MPRSESSKCDNWRASNRGPHLRDAHATTAQGLPLPTTRYATPSMVSAARANHITTRNGSISCESGPIGVTSMATKARRNNTPTTFMTRKSAPRVLWGSPGCHLSLVVTRHPAREWHAQVAGASLAGRYKVGMTPAEAASAGWPALVCCLLLFDGSPQTAHSALHEGGR